MDVLIQHDHEGDSRKSKQDGVELPKQVKDEVQPSKFSVSPPLNTMPVSLESTNVSDEFEAYAVEVEKSIERERKLTLMRLNYINQLRTPVTPGAAGAVDEESIAMLVLPVSEDMTDSDTAIMLSAIQDGNANLIRKFLSEMTPKRRHEMLTAKLGSRYGATYLQLAIENGHEEIFRDLRILMDKNTKQAVTKSRDSLGNTALHDACVSGNLSFVQSLLANFSKSERPSLIMSANDKGSSCLRQAACHEIFSLLVKQFDDQNILWSCIMMTNTNGETLAHGLMNQVNIHTHTIFKKLCQLAKKRDKVEQFLFPPDGIDTCDKTLLHSLVSNPDLTAETAPYALENMKLLFEMAELIGKVDELLWKRKNDEEDSLAIYYLASLNKQSKHIKRLAEHLLLQVGQRKIKQYIMSSAKKSGHNSIQAAGLSNNFAVLQTFFKYLPYKDRMSCFLSKSAVTGSTPLHLAASQADLAFKEILTNFDSNDRQRLIMCTDHQRNTPILIAFIDGNIDVVNSLMSEKWVPRGLIFPLMTARNKFGWTIIHLSCIRIMGDFLTVSVLKFFKSLAVANLNTLIHHTDYNGNTVLHLAALLYRPKVVEALVENIRKSDQRRYISQRNNDGLMASQLCNMADIVVVKYLQPLLDLGWSCEALAAKRDTLEYKYATQQKLYQLERAHCIDPTPIALEEIEELFDYDQDWEFDFAG